MGSCALLFMTYHCPLALSLWILASHCVSSETHVLRYVSHISLHHLLREAFPATLVTVVTPPQHFLGPIYTSPLYISMALITI